MCSSDLEELGFTPDPATPGRYALRLLLFGEGSFTLSLPEGAARDHVPSFAIDYYLLFFTLSLLLTHSTYTHTRTHTHTHTHTHIMRWASRQSAVRI